MVRIGAALPAALDASIEDARAAWSVRVYHKPLVNWIWGGALLMALGGAFAVADRRYWPEMRKQREARAVDTSVEAAGALPAPMASSATE